MVRPAYISVRVLLGRRYLLRHRGTQHYCNMYTWFGSLVTLVVRASDLRLDGRKFDSRPPHYRSVGTEMGDRLGRAYHLGM